MDDDATIVVDRDRPPSQPLSGDTLAPGTVLKNRFVLEGELGKGGMGVVYRAKDLRKEETEDRDPYVALKVLNDEFQRDRRMVVALQREARKSQTLAHPNIATVYDFDRDDKIVYLTMEVLDGKPLDEFLRDHPDGLERSRAMPIIRGLCLGLAYAHNKNIIHSDFKPGNIYLTESDQTKILDFGIARAAPTDRVEASETTQFDAGELGALTPSYAACEMFEGKDPHPADDVYALAIVAYQLLSGQHPFDSRPAPQARQLDLEPKPIKGLKRREWRALKRGLAFDRAERSQHAAEFLRDLEGGSRLKMVVGIAVTLAVIFAGYVGYVQFQERVRNAPDIPFESLAQTTQVELGRLLEEGDIFVRFGDSGSALALFREAYQLHPRNKQVVERLELLFSNLSDQAAAQSERAGLERLQENLDSVMAIDDFLGNRPSLIKARDKVANALVP